MMQKEKAVGTTITVSLERKPQKSFTVLRHLTLDHVYTLDSLKNGNKVREAACLSM